MNKEDEFREEIFSSLKIVVGAENVWDIHGINEFGLDILFKFEDVFRKHRFYGIQIKTKDLTCTKSKLTNDIKEIIGQLTIAYGHRFGQDDKRMDGIYVINDGEIGNSAIEYISDAKIGFREIYFLRKVDIKEWLLKARADKELFKET